ncbi:MAG: preprotein translocase subunit YajC [Flavobacteriaceae bacterium]|nr:preprotein translocase subunit YajC [Flavobacteriales bacterium]RCL68490.1 MAG: preprotein translocase subunit YajC [Bacteroidota bacterium]
MENFYQMAPFFLMFLVIYLFMIRPQMTKAKNERKFLTDLKTGDRVVMKSGMHGRVNHINQKEGTCIIETTAGKLKFNKSMISMDASNEINK